MPLSFPIGPSAGDTYTYNGKIWYYDGTRWASQREVVGGGAESVSIAVGTTAERPLTPSSGDFRLNTTTKNLEIYYDSSWINLNYVGLLQATGGTIVDYGGHRHHIYTTSGTFDVLNTSPNGTIDYFMIGGGGPGGADSGGGGGAGGYIEANDVPITSNTSLIIEVGSGGTSTSTSVKGTDGEPSGIATAPQVYMIQTEGGGAGGVFQDAQRNGNPGGSGGGASGLRSGSGQGDGASGTVGQGYGGGHGYHWSGQWVNGGGGGGAGGPGANGTITTVNPASAGQGGIGKLVPFDGIGVGENGGGSYYYIGGGGGGGASVTSAPADGGLGGGGNGSETGVGGNADPNTGGGGGGGYHSVALGGSGGSGIVVIRYRLQ